MLNSSLIASVLLVAMRPLGAQAQCQRAKLLAEDGATDDLFGCSVAISDNVAIVGAHRNALTGAAYVYERSGSAWEFVARLVNDGAAGGSHVGWSVAVEGDLAVIGATGTWTGVFQRLGTGWSQVARLRPDDFTPGSLFGRTVALSGERSVVGAPHDDDNGVESGSAYVFERDPNGAWPQVAKLLPSDGQYGDRFGLALAIDVDVVAVGAPDDDDLGNWSGSAYVFERDPSGAWLQTAKLLPHDGTFFWRFGTSVAVRNGLILVGADHARGVRYYSGAVYVFERDPDGVWSETAKLMPSDGQTSDAFGRSVAFDGSVAVIGAPWNQRTTCGAVYVFTQEANGAWSEIAKLTPSDGDYHDEFGCSVSISGNTAVIGAYFDDDQGTDSGSAYVFAVGPDEDANGVMDPCEECLGDLDGDQDVDLADLAELLSNYGTAQGAQYPDGDLDADGDVDVEDLETLLGHYREVCR